MQTERLLLRPILTADLPMLQQLANDRTRSRNFSDFPYPFTKKDASSFLSYIRRGQRKKTLRAFAVVDQRSNTFLGVIRLDAINARHKRAELFFWIGKKHQGNGYGLEAASGLLTYAFRTMKLHRVQAEAFADNERSKKLLQKLGFHKEGCLRKSILRGNKQMDLVIYGLLSKEFKG